MVTTMKREFLILIIIISILMFPTLTFNKKQNSGFRALNYHSNAEDMHHNPVLFLHCWTGTNYSWYLHKNLLEQDGWPASYLHAYNFDDTNNCSLQASFHKANQVKEWVDTILNQTGADKIDLVGHSLGGMIARYYIKFLGGNNMVDDYVSLGSPHHGELNTPCGAAGVNTLAVMLNEGDATPGGVLNDTIGERVDPILGYIYNSTHIPGTISYTSIYSLTDDVVPYISSVLDGAKNIPVTDVTHMAIPTDTEIFELTKQAIDDPHELSSPSLITPIGNEIIPGNVNISWTTSIDTWGYDVTYDVYYSLDQGDNWVLLITNTTETSFIWNASLITEDSNLILKILAFSSGDLSTEFVSTNFIFVGQTSSTQTTTTASSSNFITTPVSSTQTTTTEPTFGWEVLFLPLSVSYLISLRRLKRRKNVPKKK